ncbi:porin family protein [Flavobacterium rhizosphaerae]|uniref:Porin family protein n=1 Tax=Flavobacterium rhizosphaerae TaxID=3163298 RepID=A0ABW8Z120_9FLAO
MKKIIFCSTLLLGSLFTNAQNLTFGIKAGANGSDVINNHPDNGFKVGLHFGGVAELHLGEKFSLQPELLFSQQGCNNTEWYINDDLEYVEEEFTWILNYVNLPVMVKYYVFENMSIEAGPQVGYLVKTEITYETRYEYSDDEKITMGINEMINRIDLAAAAGISYKLPFDFTASLRYVLGLNSMVKDIGFSKGPKNSVFQASVTYSFL